MYYSFRSPTTLKHLNSTFKRYQKIGFLTFGSKWVVGDINILSCQEPSDQVDAWTLGGQRSTRKLGANFSENCTIWSHAVFFWHPKTGWVATQIVFYFHPSIWEMIHFDELIFFRWVGSTTLSASFTHSIAPPRSPWWTSLRPCCILGIHEEREGLGHLSPLSGGPIEMHPLKITLR